jgi:hypothetical protein
VDGEAVSQSRQRFFWWAGQIAFGFLSMGFLFMGIDTLVYAYHLKNPHEFIMYFFSSNLIILISAVGLLWPVFNIYRSIRPVTDKPNEEEDSS